MTCCLIEKNSSTQPHIIYLAMFLVFHFPPSPAVPVFGQLLFCGFFGVRVTQNTLWLILLSFSATYVHLAQSRVPGMTDVLLGMSAGRKCLEKGGGSPKRNTEALSCFCRTTATTVPFECHKVFQLKECQVRVRAQPEKYLWANAAARGYSHLYCFAYKWPPNVQVPPSSLDFQQQQLCSLGCMCINTLLIIHMDIAETLRCIKTPQSAAFRSK